MGVYCVQPKSIYETDIYVQGSMIMHNVKLVFLQCNSLIVVYYLKFAFSLVRYFYVFVNEYDFFKELNIIS